MKNITLVFLLFFPLVTFADKGEAFYKDLSYVFEVSDFEYKSINREYDIDTNFSIISKNKKNYFYSFKFSLDAEKETNESDGSKFSEITTDYQQRFEVKNIWANIHYTNFVEFAQEKMNGSYTIKYALDFGPIGLKKNFIETESIPELSLEYIPLYSYREYYSVVYNESESNRNKFIEEVLKHRFNFVLAFSFFKTDLSVTNTISIQRIEAIDNRKFYEAGNEFENRFEFNYQLVDKLTVGYMFDVNTSEVRSAQGLPKTEQIHKITASLIIE